MGINFLKLRLNGYLIIYIDKVGEYIERFSYKE